MPSCSNNNHKHMSEEISPNQARMYQIEKYRQSVQQAAAQTTQQPLKTLYELLQQELERTLEQFRLMPPDSSD